MKVRSLPNDLVAKPFELLYDKFVTLLVHVRLNLVQVFEEGLLSIEDGILARLRRHLQF